MRPGFRVLSGLLFLVLLFVGCAPRGPLSDQSSGARPPLSIVTSITVLADLVRQVGSDRVDVKALVPIGADPNTFQPPPRDVLMVSRADLVFVNGLGLDRTARNLIANAARPRLPLVVLSDDMPTLESGLTSFDRSGEAAQVPSRGNPYLWLDPRYAATYVERIRDGLIAVDPAAAADYRANAQAFLERLRVLDQEFETQLAVIPAERRKLVTLHDAFPYMAQRYGLQLIGVAIKTPGRAPSAQEVADVSRAIRDQKVPTVFTEPQLDARLLKLAARDAGIQISTLYSDSLDAGVPTYEALLRYNARQLVNGLK